MRNMETGLSYGYPTPDALDRMERECSAMMAQDNEAGVRECIECGEVLHHEESDECSVCYDLAHTL